MSSHSSTISSLSSISEDSTFGVEREDLPPSVPRRRRSFGSRSAGSLAASQAAESLESIREETLQGIHDEDGPMDNPPLKPKRIRSSHSRSSLGSTSSRRDNDENRNDVKGHDIDNSGIRQTSQGSSEMTTDLQDYQGSVGMHAREEENQNEVVRRRHNGRRVAPLNAHRQSSDSGKKEEAISHEGDKLIKSLPTNNRGEGSLTQEEEKSLESNRRRSRGERRSLQHSDAESEGHTVVEELGHHSSRYQSSRLPEIPRSPASSKHSVSSASSFQTDDSSTDFSRGTLDRRGREYEFGVGNAENCDSLAPLPSYGDESDEEQPGAYRISSHSTSQMPSSHASSAHSTISQYTSGQSFALTMNGDEATVESNSSSSSTSLCASAMVRAEVAPDHSDEIEAARERGRAEALREVGNGDVSVAVAVPRPKRERSDAYSGMPSKRKACLLFVVLLFTVACPVAYFTLKGRNEQKGNRATNEFAGNNGDSRLEGKNTFNAPSPEDCESIRNGTVVTNQSDLFTKYVHLQIDMVTIDEEDTAVLVTELLKQIQVTLLPLLVGCDSNIESGNIIRNGVVDSSRNSTTSCILQTNPNCIGVVVTLKLFILEEVDGAVVVRTMNEILKEKQGNLSKNLGLQPTVQTATVSWILPSDITDPPTVEPSTFPSMTVGDDLSESPMP